MGYLADKRKLNNSVIHELSRVYADLTPVQVLEGASKHPVLVQNLRKYMNNASTNDNHARAIREEARRRNLDSLIL